MYDCPKCGDAEEKPFKILDSGVKVHPDYGEVSYWSLRIICTACFHEFTEMDISI